MQRHADSAPGGGGFRVLPSATYRIFEVNRCGRAVLSSRGGMCKTPRACIGRRGFGGAPAVGCDGGKDFPPASTPFPFKRLVESPLARHDAAESQVALDRRSVTWGKGSVPRPTASESSGEDLFSLLMQVRRGNSAALSCLLERLRVNLHAQVSRRLRGGWTEAWIEDVVQESLLDILRGLRECRAHSDAELRAWSSTIVRRRVASLLREEKPRLMATASLTAVADIPEYSETYDPCELHAVVMEIAKNLTDAQSRILWMRLQIHATWPEIATELGISDSAAKRRFQRLIAAMRRKCIRAHAAHGSLWS